MGSNPTSHRDVWKIGSLVPGHVMPKNYKIDTCHFLACGSTFIGWDKGWFVQCWDNTNEWDIILWCQWPEFSVAQHYKVTMSAYCHKSISILIWLCMLQGHNNSNNQTTNNCCDRESYILWATQPDTQDYWNWNVGKPNCPWLKFPPAESTNSNNNQCFDSRLLADSIPTLSLDMKNKMGGWKKSNINHHFLVVYGEFVLLYTLNTHLGNGTGHRTATLAEPLVLTSN